jgi:hypothetical protein
MLSFGYQILWNHLLCLIELQGLDTIGVNLSSNPVTNCCLTIKLRSPLAPLKKGGDKILLKVPPDKETEFLPNLWTGTKFFRKKPGFWPHERKFSSIFFNT